VDHDREEILGRRVHIAHRDGLALEIGDLIDPGIGRRQQAHAAAVEARDDLDVEALLHRLQPAQRHADGGVRLAGRKGLEQLIRGAGVIDKIDIKPVFGEEALSLATVTASRQGAPAFQAKEIFFNSPDGTASPVEAARQIGNACGSNGSAARGSARLLPAATPKGTASPSVAARVRKRRREGVVASGRSVFIERLHGEGQRVAGATAKARRPPLRKIESFWGECTRAHSTSR
jgi:hypothetical protein